MKNEINSKTFDLLDNENIKEITITKTNLIDIFKKVVIINIKFNNNSEKRLKGVIPVNTNSIKKWLEKYNLAEKTKMYEF